MLDRFLKSLTAFISEIHIYLDLYLHYFLLLFSTAISRGLVSIGETVSEINLGFKIRIRIKDGKK